MLIAIRKRPRAAKVELIAESGHSAPSAQQTNRQDYRASTSQALNNETIASKLSYSSAWVSGLHDLLSADILPLRNLEFANLLWKGNDGQGKHPKHISKIVR